MFDKNGIPYIKKEILLTDNNQFDFKEELIQRYRRLENTWAKLPQLKDLKLSFLTLENFLKWEMGPMKELRNVSVAVPCWFHFFIMAMELK